MSSEARLTYVDSSAIVKLAVAEPESKTLRRIQLLRINDRVLSHAGRMEPAALRSLEAIHLASARELGLSLKQIVTYDERMAEAAILRSFTAAMPAS